MKKKVYLYPKVYPAENPYILNLEKSISPRFEIINKEFNSSGVIDLFRFLFKTDVYYFNWIENLDSRRYGKLQICIFVIFLLLARNLGKKIVWTLHNKHSHENENSRWSDFMYLLMFKYSDFIITHSGEGIVFSNENFPQYSKKVRYLVHPVRQLPATHVQKELKYDLFIWGTIWPYKGIIEFLKFLKTSGNSHLKVLIAGICINNDIKAELNNILSENIVYHDQFFEMNEIAAFSSQSKFTLFTYKTGSVLSSGSLMDSIAFGSMIIGPDTGAFKDLSLYGFIRTYNSLEDIIGICNSYSPANNNVELERKLFCNENSWEIFGFRLCYSLVNDLRLY